ncbi:hypothetical protein N8766_02340 [bacterium]|nr:hypothetical protein [bacterium]
MTLKWKSILRCTAGLSVAFALSGCGGVNATHSVSPASILLPGLISAPVEEPAQKPTPVKFDDSIESASYQLVSK